MPGVPRALRRDAQPLPPRQRALRLNAGPSAEVRASPLLRAAISAGLLAAELHRRARRPDARRARSRPPATTARAATPELPLAGGARQRAAAPRRRAQPAHLARGRRSPTHAIRRPPGVRFDTGGIGKGLAADLLAAAARAAAGRSTAAATCASPARFEVEVRHPLTQRDRPHAAASSTARSPRPGIDTRLWRAPDGSPRHHLLDPGTRRAGLDRADQRHRARADRARGRDAGQGRAAERADARRALAAPPRRAHRSPTTATSSSTRCDRRGMNPADHTWWLVSRSAGVVALLLVAVSVLIGLTLAAGLGGPPARRRALVAFHEQTALGSLIAIALHGVDPARRQLPQAGHHRDRDPVRDRLQAGVRRGRHRRRLPRRAARALVLRPPPDRRQALAQAAPRHAGRLRPGRDPHARRGHGRGLVVAARLHARDHRPGARAARRPHPQATEAPSGADIKGANA